jgi:hypothetical protein
MVNGVITGDRNAHGSGATLDLAVNADLPLTSSVRLRGEFGRASWSYSGNHLLPAPLPPEDISLTRVTAAAIWGRGDHLYAGAGAGLYRYAAQLSAVPRATRPGFHLLGGTEFQVAASGLALRLEGQLQAVGGPDARGPSGTLVALDEAPVQRSRVFSRVLVNLGAGVGVAWRF